MAYALRATAPPSPCSALHRSEAISFKGSLATRRPSTRASLGALSLKQCAIVSGSGNSWAPLPDRSKLLSVRKTLESRASCPHTKCLGAANTPSLASRRFPGSAPKRSTRSGSLVVRAVGEAAPPRMIQHKQEAFWFYRFLSIVYDHVINPGHWTEDMRDDALEPAKLDNPELKVVDVGGGTGFTTLGIVQTVKPRNVTILDQSPHQLEKAKEKLELAECTIVEGDAEDLPFPTDSCDRYVSAGSIEYWPDPQRGICEAYRVVKPGGLACIIGPVHPTFWLSRFFADMWMLFPREDEYIKWFTSAGFTDVKLKRIGPSWYRGDRRHGLIMGCSVTGVKVEPGPSPLKLGPKAEDVQGPFNPFSFAYRFIVGSICSLWFVLIPVFMWLKDSILPKDWKFVEEE